MADEVAARYSRFPDRMTADSGPADAFLRLACLAYADDQPAAMVRGELAWAITHSLADQVRLLVAHGVDVAAPFDDGVTTAARRGSEHPRPAVRLHSARLGPLFRPAGADWKW